MQSRQYMSAHASLRSGDASCRHSRHTAAGRPAGRRIRPAKRRREDVDKCTRERMTRPGAIQALTQGAARVRTAASIAGPPAAQRSRRDVDEAFAAFRPRGMRQTRFSSPRDLAMRLAPLLATQAISSNNDAASVVRRRARYDIALATDMEEYEQYWLRSDNRVWMRPAVVCTEGIAAASHRVATAAITARALERFVARLRVPGHLLRPKS